MATLIYLLIFYIAGVIISHVLLNIHQSFNKKLVTAIDAGRYWNLRLLSWYTFFTIVGSLVSETYNDFIINK